MIRLATRNPLQSALTLHATIALIMREARASTASMQHKGHLPGQALTLRLFNVTGCIMVYCITCAQTRNNSDHQGPEQLLTCRSTIL